MGEPWWLCWCFGLVFQFLLFTLVVSLLSKENPLLSLFVSTIFLVCFLKVDPSTIILLRRSLFLVCYLLVPCPLKSSSSCPQCGCINFTTFLEFWPSYFLSWSSLQQKFVLCWCTPSCAMKIIIGGGVHLSVVVPPVSTCSCILSCITVLV